MWMLKDAVQYILIASHFAFFKGMHFRDKMAPRNAFNNPNKLGDGDMISWICFRMKDTDALWHLNITQCNGHIFTLTAHCLPISSWVISLIRIIRNLISTHWYLYKHTQGILVTAFTQADWPHSYWMLWSEQGQILMDTHAKMVDSVCDNIFVTSHAIHG